MTHRILVLTVVHHPHDARIYHRQLAALLDAGWEVTYAAPFTGFGLELAAPTGARVVDVERAVGRRRLAALHSARRVLAQEGPTHDLVLLHDPELVVAAAGLRLPPVVWDVHEDTAAAVAVRPWVPRPVRPAAAWSVLRMERYAESRHTLLLADHDYARRFRAPHVVIPNTTPVPPHPPPAAQPDARGWLRVVYLGSITRERGVRELVALGAALTARTSGEVHLELIGPAHGASGALLRQAVAAGHLSWSGFVPADRALARLDGALAGVSFLHDIANFRPSMPTKLVEYMAHGLPVVTTPLPRAVDLVERSGGGVVVPFHGVDAAVDQLLAWAADPAAAREAGRRGHALVRRELDWTVRSEEFVRELERVARSR